MICFSHINFQIDTELKKKKKSVCNTRLKARSINSMWSTTRYFWILICQAQILVDLQNVVKRSVSYQKTLHSTVRENRLNGLLNYMLAVREESEPRTSHAITFNTESWQGRWMRKCKECSADLQNKELSMLQKCI